MLPRRKRSAAERRAQRQRAVARHLGWTLKAHVQLVAHRGCAGTHQLDCLVDQLRGGHKSAVSERIVKQTVDNPKPAVDAPVPQAMEGIVEVDVASAPAITYAAPSTVSEYVDPSPAVTFTAPAPVIAHVHPAPAFAYATPARVIERVSPAPAVAHATPARVIDPVACTCHRPCDAPVIEPVAPATAVTHATQAPVIEPVTPAPTATDTAPAPASEHVAPALADASAARAPVIEYGPSSPAAPAPVTDYASTSPAGTETAPATATNSVAPAPAYAALATEKKRLVWAALEGGHLDIHEANEKLADNAEALLLEEEQEARQTARKKAKRNKR